MTENRAAILLGTYNGEKYLPEQLASYEAQTHDDWALYASDDGSTDGTLDILAAFKAKWGDRVRVESGPRRGFARNFLSLVSRPRDGAAFYAFSDQDDVWDPGKLARAAAALRAAGMASPALYCARTRYIGPAGEPRGESAPFTMAPGFRHALVQNIASGNTMVLNAAALAAVAPTTPDLDAPFHDWWVYLVVTGAGGRVICDGEPAARYRQHRGNVLGENKSWRAMGARLRMFLDGTFRDWTARNLSGLERARDILTEENRAVLKDFQDARRGAFPSRLRALVRSGVRRRTFLESAALYAGAAFNRI